MVNLDFTGIIGLIALAQAVLLCFYLGLLHSKNKTAWLLIGLLLVMVVALGHDVLIHTRLAMWFPHILGTGPFHSFLIGPLTLLIVFKLINPEKPLSFWHGLHFIPFLWQQLSRANILLQSGDSKRAILENYFSQTQTSGPLNSLNWDTLLSLIGFYGHRFAYLILALYLLHKYKSHFEHAVTSRAMIRNPLFGLLTAYCISWLALRLALFTDELGPILIANMAMINSAALSLLTIFIAIVLFKHPFTDFFSAKSTQKYQHSALDKQTGKLIVDEVIRQLTEKELYSQPDIKQADIADAMGISSQLLSQSINQETQANFNEFINHFRIEHFKRLVSCPDNQSKEIQNLALESGFSSKATFYRVFKEKVGETPAQFRRSVLTTS